MPNRFCEICQEPMPEYLWSPIHIKEFPDCCKSCQDVARDLEGSYNRRSKCTKNS